MTKRHVFSFIEHKYRTNSSKNPKLEIRLFEIFFTTVFRGKTHKFKKCEKNEKMIFSNVELLIPRDQKRVLWIRMSTYGCVSHKGSIQDIFWRFQQFLKFFLGKSHTGKSSKNRKKVEFSILDFSMNSSDIYVL